MRFQDQEKKKAVTFSYDDGVTQDIRMVEMLNKYGLKSTFNINSGLLGLSGTLERNGQRISHYKVHPEDVRSIYEGHEIAAHTLTHPRLPDMDEAGIIRQAEEDRLKLSELAGYEVVGMAYPGGGVNCDERVASIIKEHTGILYARTIVHTDSMDRQEDLYRFNPNLHHTQFDRLMEMGQKFIESTPDKPQIFYIWGHSCEFDLYPERWELFDEFCKKISGRDDVFYGTNKEVLLGD